jgi:hypothetical protein
MRALVVPNLDIITKEQLIADLEADGVTIIDSSIPQAIRVELANRAHFDKWLASEKVAGANSEDYENKLRFQADASTTINPNTSSTVSTTHHNWGLAAMTQDSTTLSTTFTYSQTGANVDVVIMDTGIVVGHPEFNDLSSNTTSRINQIAWGGTQGVNFYTDPDGHGTHCAGIAAGRTQGWARDAQIYSFTTNLGGLTHGYSASQMGYITSWHNSKGTSRPTVVNMSWAVSTYYPPNHPSHFFSTGAWDINSAVYHMTRSSSYDTLVKNMVNAGIVVVCSAGNDNDRIYATNESGWNSGYWYFFDSNNDMGYGVNEKIYKEDASAHDPAIHGTSPRTGTPGAPPGGSFNNTIYFQATNNGQSPGNAWLDSGTSTRYDISVQACDNLKNKASYSNYGTPLRTWAPGNYIMSSYINKGSAQQIGSTGYYVNKLNGTSMASPQIAGMSACYLDTDSSTFGAVTTSANQQSVINFIESYDQDNDIVDWGDGLTNLHRAYMPYQDYTITWATGAGALSNINEQSSSSFDLSATVRNAASEQPYTVTHSIQTGSIPSGMSLSSAGLLDGTPDASSSGTYNFTVRVDNGFEYEDRAYSLTVNDTSVLMTLTGGITVGGGIIIG